MAKVHLEYWSQADSWIYKFGKGEKDLEICILFYSTKDTKEKEKKRIVYYYFFGQYELFIVSPVSAKTLTLSNSSQDYRLGPVPLHFIIITAGLLHTLDLKT